MKTILLATLLFSAAAFAQTHAPSIAQCRADLASWGNKQAQDKYYEAERARRDSGVKNRTPYAILPLIEIRRRAKEMGACVETDAPNFSRHVELPTFLRRMEYRGCSDFFEDIAESRMVSFILRHHLAQQFRKEDAEGLR